MSAASNSRPPTGRLPAEAAHGYSIGAEDQPRNGGWDPARPVCFFGRKCLRKWQLSPIG